MKPEKCLSRSTFNTSYTPSLFRTEAAGSHPVPRLGVVHMSPAFPAPVPVLVAAAHDGGGQAELLADRPGLGGAGAQQLVLCGTGQECAGAAPGHTGTRTRGSHGWPRPTRTLTPPLPATLVPPHPAPPLALPERVLRNRSVLLRPFPCPFSSPAPPPLAPRRASRPASHSLPGPAAIFPARP